MPVTASAMTKNTRASRLAGSSTVDRRRCHAFKESITERAIALSSVFKAGGPTAAGFL
jgi:hypothetical protein